MANFLILAPFPSWIYQEVAEEPPLVFCIGRRGGNKILAYLEHISAFSILLAYDRLECPVAPLSGASRPPRGLG